MQVSAIDGLDSFHPAAIPLDFLSEVCPEIQCFPNLAFIWPTTQQITGPDAVAFPEQTGKMGRIVETPAFGDSPHRATVGLPCMEQFVRTAHEPPVSNIAVYTAHAGKETVDGGAGAMKGFTQLFDTKIPLFQMQIQIVFHRLEGGILNLLSMGEAVPC